MTRTRLVLILAGLAALAAMGLILLTGADSTPTTASTRRLFGLWRLRHVLPALALGLLGLGFLLAAVSRQRLLGYVATLVMAGLTLGLLQLLGGVGLIDWQAMLNPGRGNQGALGTEPVPGLSVSGQTYQDTAMAWGMPPGLPADPLPFSYVTDRYGYRNTPDRPGEEIDTILLGDSILVAALVPQDQTVAAQLEAMSGERVMQIALIGIAPQQEIALFEAANLPLAGRKVIQFIFEGNDLLDSREWHANQTASEAPRQGFGGAVWQLLTRVTDRPRGTAGLPVCTIDGRLQTFLWNANSFAGVEAEADRITAALDAFDARLRAAGASLSVVFVPKTLRTLHHLCDFPTDGLIQDPAAHLGPFPAAMQAWATARGIPYLDLTPALTAAADSGQMPWFPADTHLNATGHAVMARAISDWRNVRPH